MSNFKADVLLAAVGEINSEQTRAVFTILIEEVVELKRENAKLALLLDGVTDRVSECEDELGIGTVDDEQDEPSADAE